MSRVWKFALALLLVGMAATSALAQQRDGDDDQPGASRAAHDFGVHVGPLHVKYDDGGALFLFGAFCALWAQNTRRSPWLWFFMGLLFNVITVIVLLTKNANDNFELQQYGRTSLGRRADA